MRHIYNSFFRNFLSNILITCKEHPSVLCNHCLTAIFLCHLSATFNKHSKQITFTIWVITFNIIRELYTHTRATHIRRICHYHIILLRQCFCHLHQRQQFSQCRLTGHIYIFRNLCKTVIQCRPILRCYGQNRAVFFCIMQFFNDGIHSCRELCIPIAEIVHGKFIYMIALYNSIHMGLNATAEEASVILTGFHHYRKVSQLCCTVINIQTINIVLYNACHCFTGGITVRFIYLHQHIKHIRKNMTGTGTWINNFQLIRCQRGVFLANLGKLCLHFRLLLSFFQIVVPFGIFRITVSGSIGRLFFLGRKKLLFHIRMSLQP